MHSQISRRSLLAAAGLAAFPAHAAAGQRFGFTTYQWGADWDISAIIANCTRAKALGVELRTSANYAHGVELAIDAAKRREVKKRFAGSPVALIGIASAERFDWPEPARLAAAIEAAKAHVKLSADLGSHGVRVFPNDFHPGVPEEKTIGQIARALSEIGRFAADHGQMIRVENHGSVGRLPTLRRILDRVPEKSVRIKLNSDPRDAADFAKGFELVRARLSDTLHTHEMPDEKFPFELQAKLLAAAGWDGWWLLEATGKVPDRAQALVEQRERWQAMIDRALG
jgi:sugar phosphate isomerase/epimerase